MLSVAVDAYHFVGMRGGSGGSGSYLLALIEHLSRLAEVRVVASRRNAHLFDGLVQREKRVVVKTGGDTHAEAIAAAVDDADILYAPFTSLPDSARGRIPSVIAIHDLQHRFLKACFPPAERIERDDDFFAAATKADGIITFSKTEQKNISEIYDVKVQVSAIPHAPFLVEEVTRDLQHSRIPSDRNPYIRKFGRYILYSAVNWPHKNHFRLIEAFRLLADEPRVADLKLILTGAPCVEPREHFYKALLDQPWARDRVIDLGYVSNVQLFLLLSGAEAFVFPSMYEGFGIPVLEAMRVGTPVIASDLPVMREWFSGCYEPFCDIRDSYRMAEDLCRFLDDPLRREELGEIGPARSMEFSSTRTAQETFGFLTRVADTFGRSEHHRGRPSRDVAKVRGRDRRLLFHVLVAGGSLQEIRRAAAALPRLFADGSGDVGIVFLVPYRACRQQIAASSDLFRAEDCEVLYFDETDRQRGLPRAVSFYAKTQADAAFHCFIELPALAALAKDGAALARYREAMVRSNGDADGFYLGDEPWPATCRRILETLHEAPERIEAAVPDDASIAIHHFMLANDFVLGGAMLDGSPPDWFGKSAIAELATRARIAEPRPQFAYIETGSAGGAGHVMPLVLGICEAAERAGLKPLVGGNRSTPPQAGVDRPPAVLDACFSDYSQAVEPHVTPSHFVGELSAFLGRHHIGAGDFVYLHMPYPTLLAGVLQLVATRRSQDLPVFLVRICSADETFRWHEIRETKLLRAIAELGAGRRDRIRVYVESSPLSDYFAPFAGENLPVLLNPIGPRLAVAAHRAAQLRRQRSGCEYVSFGYFGEAREEKGFHLLPDIVERVIGDHGAHRVRFSIQVSAAAVNDTEAVRAARARLERIAEMHKDAGTVRLHAAFADMDGYYAALAGCDALILPYDPGYYKFRGSGVALEGLALGIPIIVPAGTDMAVTFAGPGCVVAASCAAGHIAAASAFVVANRGMLFAGVEDFRSRSPLFKSEREFIAALTGGRSSTKPAASDERPVAIWIGNDVLRQGCSAVYDAQRDFLRRHGFEIYNVYVPFPNLDDPDGAGESAEALEKKLVAEALGWCANGFDFGCYSWTLSQGADAARAELIRQIADRGASTRRFLKLFNCNQIPAALQQLVDTRRVALVCLNYVHLLPVVEKLGLLGRKGTRVVLETHDIQAHQYAIRAGGGVDEEDKEFELMLLTRLDGVVAVNRGEYDEICERNPWARVEFLLPTMRIRGDLLRDWHAGGSGLSPHWLDLWCEREDLGEVFDLRTPASLDDFMRWILIYGRREYPSLEIEPGLLAIANAPHPEFRLSRKGPGINTLLGWIWQTEGDLARRFPRAVNPRHKDRQDFLDWLRAEGADEFLLQPDGSLTPTGSDRRTLPVVPAAPLEAIVLARPASLADADYRAGLIAWLAAAGRIDVMIVGSDHPANVAGIHRFIADVYVPHLQRQGVNLLLVGRGGMALPPEDIASGVFALGEVDFVDPLYEVVRVVAVPAAAGSGVPIKVLDALARGLCISLPDCVDPALGLSAYGFPMMKNAGAVAADIVSLLASREARAERMALAQRFAAEQLAIEVYDDKWRFLAGLPPPGQSDVPTEPAPVAAEGSAGAPEAETLEAA